MARRSVTKKEHAHGVHKHSRISCDCSSNAVRDIVRPTEAHEPSKHANTRMVARPISRIKHLSISRFLRDQSPPETSCRCVVNCDSIVFCTSLPRRHRQCFRVFKSMCQCEPAFAESMLLLFIECVDIPVAIENKNRSQLGIYLSFGLEVVIGSWL